MSLPAGTVVANYTIERLLGAGGMGTVYLARHPSLPRSDALKLLSAEFSADAEFRARFRREAELAAVLSHPNIVRVYTRGETEDGRLWIAMQFVDGTDAAAILRQGPMSVQRSLHILGEVAKALDYAHSANMLHRDIKPANFLLTDIGGPTERVLLADFGIARALNESARLTVAGSMLTTAAYASPESIEGAAVDHRSDLYALGCSLYRMLVGRTPYQDANGMTETIMAHLMAPVPRATDHAPGLPKAIDDVFATALAKDPADRFHSAADLVAAAHTALQSPTAAGGQGPPPTAPWSAPPTPPPTQPPAKQAAPQPPPSSPAAGPRARRRRGLLGAAAAAVVAAVVGAAVMMWPDTTPEAPAYAAQTFEHTFGATRVATRPTAVATMSVADADVALSLGVQPVALSVTGGTAPSWLAAMITGKPAIVSTIDPEALRSAHPDLIIDTAEITKPNYNTLTKVAPTITRPADTDTTWSRALQLSWIAQILGEQHKVDDLQQHAAAEAAAIRSQHPELAGRTVSVFTFSDAGMSAELSTSPAAEYLSGLGMTYNPALAANSAASTRPVAPDQLITLTSDLTLVIRTDAAAKGGGYAGLPSALHYGGAVAVIDEPDLITA
ncbi:MAG: protein kinase, partial [Actinomycetia bacterium]|nr:protein kinase [Actinomycetes bacterium]